MPESEFLFRCYSDPNSSGSEVRVPIKPGTSLAVPAGDWGAAPLGWLRLRAGSAAHPAPQETDRTITLTLLDDHAEPARGRK